MLRTCLMLSIVVSLVACDELLPPGDQTSPEYWADYFLDKYADELVVGELEPGPPPLDEPRTVLLITGVTIRAQWFEPIVARLQRDGFNPVVYEPPDLLSYDLFEATRDLADVVEQVLEESGQDRIDILAECTGGVIARHYIQSMGGDQTVSRMVTFVSPQHGVDKAPLAALIAGWPALYDLSPGSELLRAINEAPLPENVAFTSIYTCTDEYIRPVETSIIPGANNIGLCDGFVGHFQTFYDPEIYLIMHRALTEPLEGESDVPADEVPEDDETTTDGDTAEPDPVVPEDDATVDSGTEDEGAGAVDDPGTPGSEDIPDETTASPAEIDDSADEIADLPAGPEPQVQPAGAWDGGNDPDSAEVVGCSAAGAPAVAMWWLALVGLGLCFARRRSLPPPRSTRVVGGGLAGPARGLRQRPVSGAQ